MADSVLTTAFRERIAARNAGKSALPAFAYLAFGTGGHDPDTLEVVPVSASQTALNSEVLRKAATSINQEDSLSITVKASVAASELNGEYISECGLLDEDGNLVAVKNFSPKIKEESETYEYSITVRF